MTKNDVRSHEFSLLFIYTCFMERDPKLMLASNVFGVFHGLFLMLSQILTVNKPLWALKKHKHNSKPASSKHQQRSNLLHEYNPFSRDLVLRDNGIN